MVGWIFTNIVPALSHYSRKLLLAIALNDILATAEVPDDLPRELLRLENLPTNWRGAAAPGEVVRFGDEFTERAEHCLLLVPSVLVPNESNCLINPAHPDFRRIAPRPPEPLRFDPRMFGKRRGRRR